MRILIVKTGALGDVLRTTSILPGLARRHPGAEIVWLTAPGARELVERHPLVARVVLADPAEGPALAERLAGPSPAPWDWVLSLDDEEPLCALATALPKERLSGAFLEGGARRYTPDVAPWFDMGLLSVHGKAEADRRKVANARSHAHIFAQMLGIEPGHPELPLAPQDVAFAADWARRAGAEGARPLVGLNTGAGGRWPGKELPVERTVELVERLAASLGAQAGFVVLGGASEEERMGAILAGARALPAAPRVLDGGARNTIAGFAAIVSLCDALVTSDSLALHVAIARRVPPVAFFAPTSAAEIELYGRGEKVASLAPDACSYRPDADTSTLTAERLHDAALRVLGARQGEGWRADPPRG